MFNFKTATRWSSAVAVAAAALATPLAGAATLAEGFTSTTTAAPLPTGWTAVNNSDVLGSETWVKGATSPFTAQAGATTSYISASFNATNGNVISDWLILPTLSFDNGDVLSFYTRTPTLSQFPDRLEVRFSSVGGTDVGTTASSVGTFSTLLLTVNPTLAASAYPETWTQYSATISGLSGTTSGAVAFRYYVTGTADFTNGNFIGIDTVSITAVPEPGTYLLMALGGGALMLRRRSLKQG
jgi:hypothetical protein